MEAALDAAEGLVEWRLCLGGDVGVDADAFPIGLGDRIDRMRARHKEDEPVVERVAARISCIT